MSAYHLLAKSYAVLVWDALYNEWIEYARFLSREQAVQCQQEYEYDGGMIAAVAER